MSSDRVENCKVLRDRQTLYTVYVIMSYRQCKTISPKKVHRAEYNWKTEFNLLTTPYTAGS